jgi:hypothetical protein
VLIVVWRIIGAIAAGPLVADLAAVGDQSLACGHPHIGTSALVAACAEMQ